MSCVLLEALGLDADHYEVASAVRAAVEGRGDLLGRLLADASVDGHQLRTLMDAAAAVTAAAEREVLRRSTATQPCTCTWRCAAEGCAAAGQARTTL